MIEQRQSQSQQLSQRQMQSVRLLQMSASELEGYLRELAQENPMVDLETGADTAEVEPESDLLARLRWLEENDRQNLYYQRVETEEFEPLARVGDAGGLAETLQSVLLYQLDRLELAPEVARGARFLAACLDEGGYLRPPLAELSEVSGLAEEVLRESLAVLQSLEPAGVGAANLAECLALQLERRGETGAPLAIVRTQLEALAKRNYRRITAELGLSVEEIRAAETVIRSLEPRPGAAFEQSVQPARIIPDVFITEENGVLCAHTRQREYPPFHIDAYYQKLLSASTDREVRAYLGEKLRQAENVLWAIGHRESTLQRCAQIIAERQAGFFRSGSCALLPLRQAEVAAALGVHESTVSRAIREKYVQCARGVFPMHYFFTRSAAAREGESELGGAAARALLQRLIAEEETPLSDRLLAEAMAKNGSPVSRRTVAKYRQELGILGASARQRADGLRDRRKIKA